MKNIVTCVILLICSNIFMTFAWYGHLKHMKSKFWIFAVIISWGIAFFEYLLQVPANRIGNNQLSVPQLKIIQEVIALSVFIPIAIIYLGDKPKTGYYLASACMLAAVYFVFWFDK